MRAPTGAEIGGHSAPWKKQKCFAYLLKDLWPMEAEKTRGAARFPRGLLGLLEEALALGRERQTLVPEVFRARQTDLEHRLDALISPKRRLHLFAFRKEEEVDATNNLNNLAERMLRPAVITRKTGGCNRSPPGARTHEILASLLVTLRQQGHDILGFLPEMLSAREPLYPTSFLRPQPRPH